MAHANAQAPQKVPAVTAAQPMAPQTSVAGAAITEVSQPLSGRLFYSREQRERMDRARARGDAIPGTTEVAPTPSTLNGFVKRSDGQTMIWVDGQPRYNSASRELANLSPQDVGGSGNRVEDLVRESRAANQPKAHVKRKTFAAPRHVTVNHNKKTKRQRPVVAR